MAVSWLKIIVAIKFFPGKNEHRSNRAKDNSFNPPGDSLDSETAVVQ